MSTHAVSLEVLNQMPKEELIRLHDITAKHTAVGVNYYLDELKRRDQAQSDAIMVDCTKKITSMTKVMSIATIVNVVLVIVTIAQNWK